MNLENLPQELFEQIISKMSHAEITKICNTNKKISGRCETYFLHKLKSPTYRKVYHGLSILDNAGIYYYLTNEMDHFILSLKSKSIKNLDRAFRYIQHYNTVLPANFSNFYTRIKTQGFMKIKQEDLDVIPGLNMLGFDNDDDDDDEYLEWNDATIVFKGIILENYSYNKFIEIID